MSGLELVRSRRSVRGFDGKGLSAEEIESILSYARSVETPYGIPVDWRLLNTKTDGLTCPVVTGTELFIAGKMRREPHAEEAFGYAFEKVVLFAASKGIGTTWIAGTMDRAAFERAVELQEGEVMPCVSPLGRAAAKMPLRESMMRKGVKADSRLPFGELFFDGGFDKALSAEKEGKLGQALEMVRWAPSAVNRQPWRALVAGNAVHFYEKQSKGYVSADGWDIQKIDMGIALSHFALGMEEAQIRCEFAIADPGIAHPADTVYTASFLLG